MNTLNRNKKWRVYLSWGLLIVAILVTVLCWATPAKGVDTVGVFWSDNDYSIAVHTCISGIPLVINPPMQFAVECMLDDCLYDWATYCPQVWPWPCGDVNCSDGADIDDIVWLIEYVFAGGPAPCDCE